MKLITTAFDEIARDSAVGVGHAPRHARADRAGDPAETHPSFWAPFVVVGRALRDGRHRKSESAAKVAFPDLAQNGENQQKLQFRLEHSFPASVQGHDLKVRRASRRSGCFMVDYVALLVRLIGLSRTSFGNLANAQKPRPLRVC